MNLSPTQKQIVKLVAQGMSYPDIAAKLAETGAFKWDENARLVRHHADVAARKLLPTSKLPTRQRLTLWWERRKG